jgi:hypothetical protein
MLFSGTFTIFVYMYAHCTIHCRGHTGKKVSGFPVRSRDVTNQTLPGLESLNYSLPVRVWLVTYRLGTGKSITSFLQCTGTHVQYNNCDKYNTVRAYRGAYEDIYLVFTRGHAQVEATRND